MREWLVNLRNGKSQACIAEKLGISQQYYSDIERGCCQKNMTLQMCQKIADVFGITIADVISFEIKAKQK